MSDDPISASSASSRDSELFAALEEETGPEFAEQQRLRKRFDDAIVRLAPDSSATCGGRGEVKFSCAGAMWFDPDRPRTVDSEAVARHKAARFAAAEGPVIDLCSGIGARTPSRSAGAGTVVTVDRSPLAGWMTRENARVYGCADRIEIWTADVAAVETRGQFVHIDPDRRPGRTRAGQRTIRVEEAEPGLDYLNSLIETARGGAIKLSPAANFGGKFPSARSSSRASTGSARKRRSGSGPCGASPSSGRRSSPKG